MVKYKELIKTIYLYTFSLVGLVLIIIGSIKLINLGLKTYIFTKADKLLIYPAPIYPKTPGVEQLIPEEQKRLQEEQLKYEKEMRISEKQREVAYSVSFLIVGIPVFLYHWRLVQKNDNKES